jgi:hypothetical protein
MLMSFEEFKKLRLNFQILKVNCSLDFGVFSSSIAFVALALSAFISIIQFLQSSLDSDKALFFLSFNVYLNLLLSLCATFDQCLDMLDGIVKFPFLPLRTDESLVLLDHFSMQSIARRFCLGPIVSAVGGTLCCCHDHAIKRREQILKALLKLLEPSASSVLLLKGT